MWELISNKLLDDAEATGLTTLLLRIIVVNDGDYLDPQNVGKSIL